MQIIHHTGSASFLNVRTVDAGVDADGNRSGVSSANLLWLVSSGSMGRTSMIKPIAKPTACDMKMRNHRCTSVMPHRMEIATP